MEEIIQPVAEPIVDSARKPEEPPQSFEPEHTVAVDEAPPPPVPEQTQAEEKPVDNAIASLAASVGIDPKLVEGMSPKEAASVIAVAQAMQSRIQQKQEAPPPPPAKDQLDELAEGLNKLAEDPSIDKAIIAPMQGLIEANKALRQQINEMQRIASQQAGQSAVQRVNGVINTIEPGLADKLTPQESNKLFAFLASSLETEKRSGDMLTEQERVEAALTFIKKMPSRTLQGERKRFADAALSQPSAKKTPVNEIDAVWARIEENRRRRELAQSSD